MESEITTSDPADWTKLQTEVCMRIARGKLDAFTEEARYLAALVRYGLLTRATAADYLQEAAQYNQLSYEYGAEAIQEIMATAFVCEAA
jgi:hypothetical protein